MKATVTKKLHFNAAHRLFNKNWSDEKNKSVFGKCSNSNYHGHNYVLYISVKGEIDAETGYVYDLGKLKDIAELEIIEKFDHKNLNLDVNEFVELNPTVENIAVVIWNILREKIDTHFELSIKLFETERNFVEYDGK